jgi:APA family basic amino acid/polyamine antiporter
MTSFFLAANYSFCCIALLVLRRREPDLPRPYRAWGYPLTAWLVAAGSLIFLLGMLAGDMFNGFAAVALLAVGLCGRILFKSRNIGPEIAQREDQF